MKNWVRWVDSLLPCERMGMEKAAPAAAPRGSRGSRLFAKGTSSCGRATAGALAAVGRTRRERPLLLLLLLRTPAGAEAFRAASAWAWAARAFHAPPIPM